MIKPLTVAEVSALAAEVEYHVCRHRPQTMTEARAAANTYCAEHLEHVPEDQRQRVVEEAVRLIVDSMTRAERARNRLH